MEPRRVPYPKFSIRSLLHGREIPVSKVVPAAQVHHDYFPVRTAGRVLVTASTSPVLACYRCRPAEQEEVRTQGQWSALPAQLVASASFPQVPAVKSADGVGKGSDARTRPTPKLPIFRAEHHSRPVDFEPYTLQDYQRLKPAFSQALGGLGPARIGTEQWTRGVRKLQRIRKFAEGLRRSHTIGP